MGVNNLYHYDRGNHHCYVKIRRLSELDEEMFSEQLRALNLPKESKVLLKVLSTGVTDFRRYPNGRLEYKIFKYDESLINKVK